jgi:hypothetical protein
MKDGYHADDIYRMVEDEFVATAKLYTQHIHYAEYVRLKKLAASRGKDALAGLHRGTDGKTSRSTTLKLRQEAEDNAEQRAQGQGDSDDDDEYLMDPQLAGLMTGGSRFREVLSHDLTVKISANKSNTRAAAGYSQSPHKEHKTFDIFGAGPSRNLSKPTSRSSLVVSEDDETDEDDLNAAPPPAVIPTRFSARAGSVPGAPTWDGVRAARDKLVELSRGTDRSFDPKIKTSGSGLGVHSITSESTTSSDNRLHGGSMPLSGTKTFANSSIAEDEANKKRASEHLAQKRAAREQREREEKRKSAKTVTIPTFIL